MMSTISIVEAYRLYKSDKKRCVGGGFVWLFHFFHRIGTALKGRGGISRIVYVVWAALYYFYMRFLGNDIPLGVKVGKGLCLTHLIGIIINYNVEIGDNCTIFQNVTIGTNGYWEGCGVPKIGNNVVICAGSILVGKISIGDNVIIAAGSVVNKDIPSGVIVGGIPATIISSKGEERSQSFLLNMGEG